jgi:16S rRNA (guanine966-N2)-methyltransferase
VRVVSGELRGRRIESPAGDVTRPTTDKVREAVFNALGSAGILDGATVLDLFAGTGAMGIEALSRGATRCVFVERDRNALVALRRNVESLGLGSRSEIVQGDALAAVPREADILIADPPYGFGGWDDLVARARAPFLVLEADVPVPAPEGWETVRERRYGRTHVTFLARATD